MNNDFSAAVIDALAALQNGDRETAAPAGAKVMRLLSEAILPHLHAGTLVVRAVDGRRVWTHPEGYEVTLSPCGSLGFAVKITHALGTIEGGFRFLEERDNAALREALEAAE